MLSSIPRPATRMLCGLVWLLAACDASEAPLERSPVPRVEGAAWVVHEGRLFDAEDRQVLLRGINARVEGLFDVDFDDGRIPLQPIPPFDGEDCRFLAETLGFNHLRLPVNWSGIEPERGQIDEDYIDRIVALVDACATHGVWTIVDLHQDAWSKHIGEDGAPLWAIIPEPEELLEGPLTDLAERRLSDQVMAAFRSFWHNVDGLQDAYAAMAAQLAIRLDGRPGMVGLEIMNEPVLAPAGVDPLLLEDFHRRVAAAVRAVAPGMVLVFEPDAIRNFVDQAQVPGPFEPGNALYAPHLYTRVFTGQWAGTAGDRSALIRSAERALLEAEAYGAGLYIGEFGNDPRHEAGRIFIRTATDILDRLLAHWAFWVYEEWSQDSWGLYDMGGDTTAPVRGPLRPEALDLLARAWPQAVDGELEQLAWDAESRQLLVRIRQAGNGSHRIAVPAHVFPDDVHVRCDGQTVSHRRSAGAVEVRCRGGRLELGPAESG